MARTRMSIDDQIEDAIALSRRTFLIGAASTLALAALPLADVVLKAESAENYARRIVTGIDFACVGATESAVARLDLSRNGGRPIISTAINVLGHWVWRAHPEEALVLLNGDYLKMTVEPVVPGISYMIGLCVWDMDYEGYWLPFAETHELPSGRKALNRLSLDPPLREGPGGVVFSPPPLPAIVDPRDLPPALYRNLDI